MSTLTETLERRRHRPAEVPHERLLETDTTPLSAGGVLLALAWTMRSKARVPLAIGGAALVGGALLSRANRRKHGKPAAGVRAQRGFRFETAIACECSPEKLYRAWRDFERLPEILRHLDRVRDQGNGRSHWIAKGPLGPIEWDAEIITDRENELLAWQSLPGSSFATAGSIHFQRASADRGTILRLSLKYDPPGGKLAATIASLFGQGLENDVRQDLREFKQLMEAGEIATTAGQPQGSCGHGRKGDRS